MTREAMFILAILCVLIISFLGYGSVCPTVAVIIPETVIIERVPRPVPDPAAETGVIHHFVDYGFHVVDQTQVKLLCL